MSDEEWDEEPGFTLASIEKAHDFNINLRSNYAAQWGSLQAFRELVQNWRDAIIQSFGLLESQFRVIHEQTTTNKGTEILYKVPNPVAKFPEFLGYIRFSDCQGSTNGSYTGFVEIANRSATLEPAHLEVGGTTKTQNQNQAGIHGEGLKIALLALQRGEQNHSVQCHTGSFKWTFNFTNRGKLVARLRRMSDKQLSDLSAQAQKDFESGVAPFAASPERDVQFIIGGPAPGSRDERGDKKPRRPVSLKNFDHWRKAALFLQDTAPHHIIETPAGDLILDPRLRGHIYLKGLLVQEPTTYDSTGAPAYYPASITGKVAVFSYNFHQGQTNRDRQFLSGPVTECQGIFEIWDRVLRLQPGYVDRLHKVLMYSSPKSTEVSMAQEAMMKSTVDRLRAHLFSDAKKWYYSRAEKAKDNLLEQRIRNLSRVGEEMPDEYWSLLAKHGPCQTVEEEEQKRFQNATPATIPPTDFAKAIVRYLRICFDHFHETKNVSVQFVKAGSLPLHTVYVAKGQSIKVHERWLQRKKGLQELEISAFLRDDQLIFHTVKTLYANFLDTAPIQLTAPGSGVDIAWQKRRRLTMIEIKISQSMNDAPKALGTNDPPGTAFPAFAAHTEKEPNSTATNTFQSVLFQDHYQNWSAEELRVTDYTVGRRHGNARGRGGGSFGRNSGFEGVGVNNKKSTPPKTAFGVTNNNSLGTPGGTPSKLNPIWRTPSASPGVENVNKTSYQLGDSLDVVNIAEKRDWYKAGHDGSDSVIIGIAKRDGPTNAKRQCL